MDDGTVTWSYQELDRRAEALARRLGPTGHADGKPVALLGQLDATSVAALHAVWKSGGTVAPLDPRRTEREISAALKLLDPRVLLLGSGVGGDWRGWSESRGVRMFPMNGHGQGEGPLAEAPEATSDGWPGLSPEGRAAWLFTSGTSGRPSRVPITVENLLASAHASRERLGLLPADRWLGSLSVAHVGGMALVTRAAVLGSGLILRGPFHVHGFLDLVRAGAVTHASLVPTMLFRAVREWGGGVVPDSLRCLLVGGAPAPEELVSAALELGFPVALTYGLTEATSQVATAPPALVSRKPGSVGAPLPGVTVRVETDGEICVQGPTVAPGTARKDGWLHTGDLGRVDADGHLWITGRKSDRIISGGVNVDPLEVERALEAHPMVLEAGVVGLPDREWGERVVAAVVVQESAVLTEGSLEKHVRLVLAAASRPRAFRFVDSLPRNENGKVDRERIRSLFG